MEWTIMSHTICPLCDTTVSIPALVIRPGVDPQRVLATHTEAMRAALDAHLDEHVRELVESF